MTSRRPISAVTKPLIGCHVGVQGNSVGIYHFHMHAYSFFSRSVWDRKCPVGFTIVLLLVSEGGGLNSLLILSVLLFVRVKYYLCSRRLFRWEYNIRMSIIRSSFWKMAPKYMRTRESKTSIGTKILRVITPYPFERWDQDGRERV